MSASPSWSQTACAEVERLENTDKPSPSTATLTRYAQALGIQLELRFV